VPKPHTESRRERESSTQRAKVWLTGFPILTGPKFLALEGSNPAFTGPRFDLQAFLSSQGPSV
jgi:hypothetical protein